jgi:hypothetical protein
MNSHSEMPPLKRPPVYGVFRWWPEDGEAWIHPHDTGIVKGLIPGPRVFRREDLDETWALVTYGDVRFRIRPAIWLEVEHEGFDVGDWVEIKSRMGQADPFVGRIRDMHWNHANGQIEYFVDRADLSEVRAWLAEDLAPVDPIDRPNLSDDRR